MPRATAFAAKLEGTSPTYTAVLIAGAGSGVSRPEDLKGKTVVFGDPASTSSHLIPKSMLARAGLEAGRDYKEVVDYDQIRGLVKLLGIDLEKTG
jgi:phosphonate transport system substrate-binding protein